MEWQPIETAPMDAEHILLLVEGAVIEGWWDRYIRRDGSIYEPEEWSVATLSSHGCGCCSSQLEQPTHWMPRPPPPGE